jgi:hypothetical protein
MIFAYVGPETMMPVASVIAAIFGVAMMFGRNIMMTVRGFLGRFLPGNSAKMNKKSK